jgi:hypothetical protein
MTLAVEIKAKGYWQTVIRPSQHVENRIADLASIPTVLGGLSINRRGWDFPHVDRPESTLIGNDWVGQETIWKEFRELWRVTQSGQFLHLGGIRYDWGDARYLSVMQQVTPGAPLIGIGDSLHRLSEIFEFAQRWEKAIAETERVGLSLEIGGLLNRQLVVDHPTRTASSMVYVARVGEPFKWAGEIEPGTSLEKLWAISRDVATGLFARFGFQANSQVLEDWQKKIGQ